MEASQTYGRVHSLESFGSVDGPGVRYVIFLYSRFLALMAVTDLLLVDIKEMYPQRHRALTGVDGDSTLDMLRLLDRLQKSVWIRHVLVPQWTDFDKDLHALRAFLDTLHNIERVEVLPYHTMGIFKWAKLGIPYPLAGISPPDKARIANAENILGC